MSRMNAIAIVALVLASTVAHAASQKRDLPESKGHYVLQLPKDHDPKKSYDLVVSLHGAGDTAGNFANFWSQQVAGRDGTILAVPEASSPMGPGFTWSTEDLARVVETIDDAAKNFGADRKRVLLTGHSAGCAVGFYMMAERPELFACFGGVAHCVQGFVDQKKLEKAGQLTAVYYAVGKKDPNHSGYQMTVDTLNKHKFNLVNEDPDVGHTITPDMCKKMLAHFDSTADKIGRVRLADAKKVLAAKNWGAAETALAGVASGRGASAQEAKELLDGMRKEFSTKFEAAKALKGPDAIAALEKLVKEYPGTTLAKDAKDAADAIAKDPATAQIAEQRRKEALETKAQAAMKDAETAEAAGKLVLAQESFARIATEFAETSVKAKAEAAATRLKSDPRLTAAKNKTEADKLMKRAENYLKNGATDQAKEILTELAEKYPDTEAGKKAKDKAAGLQ